MPETYWSNLENEEKAKEWLLGKQNPTIEGNSLNEIKVPYNYWSVPENIEKAKNGLKKKLKEEYLTAQDYKNSELSE